MSLSQNRFIVLVISLTFVFVGSAALADGGSSAKRASALEFKKGDDVEKLWRSYAATVEGFNWGSRSTYPEYDKVKEGDILLIQLKQGNCLMEFFHSRWRRANDVRRWHESINNYGACPHVFD